MQRKNIAVFFILSVSSLLVLSCRLIDCSIIKIELPEDPGLDVSSWIIEYPASIENGLPVYSEMTVADDVKIVIARGINLPVFARPVIDSVQPCGFPAAAVYPADLNRGILKLNWEDGFACEIIRSCLFNSDTLRGFDTRRFRESITEKAAELEDEQGFAMPGGSWLIDPVPIKARLGYGLFRESSITAAETMTFSLPFEQGEWVSDNPQYSPVDINSLTVPINIKTAFFNHESGSVIEVFFDECRWCWANLTTGESESGRR